MVYYLVFRWETKV